MAQSLSNIGKYKSKSLQNLFKDKMKKDEVLGQSQGVESAIELALEDEFKLMYASLKNKGHIGKDTSQTIGQSIGVQTWDYNGGKFTITIGTGGDVGNYLNKGTKRAKTMFPPNSMLYALYTWGNAKGIFETASGKKKQMSLAYGMARSILQKGIVKRFRGGSHWKDEAIGENNEKLIKRLTDKISGVLGRSVEITVTNEANKMLNGSNSKSNT